MRILVLCPHFAPDTAPTGTVMTALALGLADLGHELSIITSVPWYRHHAVEPDWTGTKRAVETTDWGEITRLHPFPTDKANIPARALAFGGFTAMALAEAARPRHRPDVVFAMSPPLTLGTAGVVLARRWRVPLLFNIQDVFPDVAIELGKLTGPRAIAAARQLERRTYEAADAVTVLSDDLRSNVEAKLTDGSTTRVEVIPNFVDTNEIRPMDRHTAYRSELGIGEETVVLYAGNVGFSQSLDLVIEAARRYRDRDDVVFVINGEGSARSELERQADGLTNIRFVGYQERDRLSEVLASGDIHLVPLKRGLAASSVPSKLYSILAAGRPVLASVDAGTEVDRTVTTSGAGLSVAPDDPDAFTGGLTRLIDDVDLRHRCGSSARDFVEGWASPRAVAQSYDSLLHALVDAGPIRTRHRRK